MFVRRMPMPDALPEPARLLRDMERLFGSLWGNGDGAAGLFPPVNVTRDAHALRVRADLPGIDPEELRLSVEGRQLSLAGSRRIEQPEGASAHRRERPAGAFDRTIVLPVEFDAAKVDARYTDGVLTITLPLTESAKGRQIQIQKS